MTAADPAKVNAMRKLTEAAEASGWTVGKAHGKIALYAPGLDDPRVNFKRKHKDLKVYELGHWRPAVGTSPEAWMILFRFKPFVPSSRTFVREPPLKERIGQWFGSDIELGSGNIELGAGNIELGAGGNYENVLGEVEYLRFTRDGATECVFMRQYGDTFSDQRDATSLGNIMIRGYYCVAPFHELSQRTLERFLYGIGLKGFGVLEKPVDLTLAAAPIAAAAVANGQRQSASSGAFPYAVKFTSMVFKTSEGHELADEFDEVSLDHGRVYVYVSWRGLTKESHLAQLRVFDGAGKQAGTSSYEFTPNSTRWYTWLNYYIDSDVDQPGRWRFEMDLDGETLVERSLIVTPSAYGSARSGINETSRDAAFRVYQVYDEAFKYKVFVRNGDGAWAWRVREAFYSAQGEALQACHKRSKADGQPGECRVYAAGDDVVWDMSEKERKDVIRAYKE